MNKLEGTGEALALTASIEGRFGKGYPWQLSVNPDRKARLTIDAYPKTRTREFPISIEQMDELSSVLERERFFALQSDYGERVPDGSTETITIVKNGAPHTVRIHYLMNWVRSDTARLKEPARALRIFKLVRSWFDDPDAVDLRKYDDMVLKVAGDSAGRP